MSSAPRPPRWPKDPPPRLAASPAVDALAADLAAGVDPAAATAAFWAAAEVRGTPLVDVVAGAPGERVVTFLWRDRHGPDAGGTRAVLLLANKLTDPSVPDESGLERLPGTDVWWRGLRLSSAWRGTYALAVDDGEEQLQDAESGPASRWRGLAARATPDPRNPRTFPGGRGGGTLSTLELQDAPPQPWTTLPAGAARGTIEEVRLPGLVPGEGRRAWVHTPAGAPPAGPHHLLVLLDGDEWMGRRDAPTTLDALHHAGRIRPTITLMVDGADTARRWDEMTAGDPYLDLLTAVLPAWMRERHPVGPGREHVVLAGQSLGGLAVLRAAVRAPGRVGAVIVQSASLWWDGQEAVDAPSPTVEQVRTRPPHGVRVHAQVGRDEWVLLRSHRELASALAEAGVDHALQEYEGGHDGFCWRGGLADALIAVLGPEGPDAGRRGERS